MNWSAIIDLILGILLGVNLIFMIEYSYRDRKIKELDTKIQKTLARETRGLIKMQKIRQKQHELIDKRLERLEKKVD